MITNPYVRTCAVILAGGLVLCCGVPAATAVAGERGTGATPSTFHAGYTWDDGPVVKARTKFFTVPALLECDGLAAITIGIQDEPTSGVRPVVAVVLPSCNEVGDRYYATVARAGPAFETGNVLPGDKLTFTVTYDGANATAKVRNRTHPEDTISVTGHVSQPTAGLHFGAGTTYGGPRLPVPNFGSAQMLRSRVNGIKVSKTTCTKYNRVTDGELEIRTGKARHGSFDLTFVSP